MQDRYVRTNITNFLRPSTDDGPPRAEDVHIGVRQNLSCENALGDVRSRARVITPGFLQKGVQLTSVPTRLARQPHPWSAASRTRKALPHSPGCGPQVPAAFRMFEQLQAAGAAVDVVTGTTLMSASLRQNRPELSMAMLAEIRAAGLPLDTVVYKNAFIALGRLGDWQQALQVCSPPPRLRRPWPGPGLIVPTSCNAETNRCLA
jgi:hypothetical protein